MKAIDLKNGLQEIASNPINQEVDIELAEKLIFDFLSQYDAEIKDITRLKRLRKMKRLKKYNPNLKFQSLSKMLARRYKLVLIQGEEKYIIPFFDNKEIKKWSLTEANWIARPVHNYVFTEEEAMQIIESRDVLNQLITRYEHEQNQKI